MRVLALLPLAGCLFAPDRPSDPIIAGTEIDLDPPSCLGTFFLDTYAVGASTLDGGDAIWRGAVVDGKTHVWEFVPSVETAPSCFELGFVIPDETGRPVAIDATRVGDQVVIAVMIANPTLSFAEIAIDSGNRALLASSISSTLAIHPDRLANADSIVDYAPRYLHRTSDGLWFGGGDQLGTITEASIGVAGAPMLRSIPTRLDESFVDMIPPSVAIGDADICALDGDLSCTIAHSHGCVSGDCHIQSTGVVAFESFAGFAVEQPFEPNPAELDLIATTGDVEVEALQPVVDLPYFQGAVVTPSGDALALWYPHTVGPMQPGMLAIYPAVTANPGSNLLPVTLAEASAYGEDTVVVYGTFAGIDAAVILGDRPADLSCFDVATSASCTHP